MLFPFPFLLNPTCILGSASSTLSFLEHLHKYYSLRNKLCKRMLCCHFYVLSYQSYNLFENQSHVLSNSATALVKNWKQSRYQNKNHHPNEHYNKHAHQKTNYMYHPVLLWVGLVSRFLPKFTCKNIIISKPLLETFEFCYFVSLIIHL